MANRNDLGGDWNEIISEWYLGRVPDITNEDGWAALGALERLWPERTSTLTAGGSKGVIFIAPVVDVGLDLVVCEHLPGFEAVLDRMKLGERSAMTEMHLLAALTRAGYSVLVEPEVHGKRPDAAVRIDSELVYIEVVVPDESEEHMRLETLVTGLARRLCRLYPGNSVDIFLEVEPTEEVVKSVFELVGHAAASPHGPVVAFPGIGFARVTPIHSSPALLLTPPEPPDQSISDLPSIGSMSFEMQIEGQVLPGQALAANARAYVQVPFTDDRAQRLMQKEAHHFSREAMNVLVMDISTTGGRRGWPPLVQRRFQPAMNRRFGGVVLFDSRLDNTGVIRNWFVLPNPYALKQLPDRLLADFPNLD